MCGYLFFGLRIHWWLNFPGCWFWGYLCKILISNHLSLEICRPCPGTCRIYSAEAVPCSMYICSSDLLTKHIRKFPLGNSGLGPAVAVAARFLPAPTLWHCCLRVLPPSCVTLVLPLKLYETFTIFPCMTGLCPVCHGSSANFNVIMV